MDWFKENGIGVLVWAGIIGAGFWGFGGSDSSNSFEYLDDDSSTPSEYVNTDYSTVSSYEEYYSEGNLPNGSYTVEACSSSSGNCYDLDADIIDGVVDTIYFSSGGYLDVEAELDEDGYGYGESYNGDEWEINCYDCY